MEIKLSQQVGHVNGDAERLRANLARVLVTHDMLLGVTTDGHYLAVVQSRINGAIIARITDDFMFGAVARAATAVDRWFDASAKASRSHNV